MPTPILKIASKSGGVIEKNMLIAQPHLIVEYLNIPVNADFLICNFVVEVKYYISKKQQINFGDKLSDAQIKLIQDATTGNKITFKDIKITNKKGKKLILEPIIFTIK